MNFKWNHSDVALIQCGEQKDWIKLWETKAFFKRNTFISEEVK